MPPLNSILKYLISNEGTPEMQFSIVFPPFLLHLFLVLSQHLFLPLFLSSSSASPYFPFSSFSSSHITFLINSLLIIFVVFFIIIPFRFSFVVTVFVFFSHPSSNYSSTVQHCHCHHLHHLCPPSLLSFSDLLTFLRPVFSRLRQGSRIQIVLGLKR